jgi:uncharacterized protein
LSLLRISLGVVVALLLVALLVVIFRARVEHRLTYFPDRALTTTPAALGLKYADVALVAADGVRLHAWHVAVAAPRALVLVLHGNGGNIEHRLPLAAALAAANLETLLLDYRGYGRSEGRPSEGGLYADADAAFSWAAARGLPVILYGESLGGAVATHLAARRPPAALCLQGAFTSLPEMAARTFPFGRALARQRFDTLGELRSVRVPVLVIHGDRDEIVPVDMGRRLHQQAPAARELYLVPGAGHNDLVDLAAPEIARRVGALLP